MRSERQMRGNQGTEKEPKKKGALKHDPLGGDAQYALQWLLS